MKSVTHRSTSRGGADFGWLKSHHSFSFASYYDPERMGFGLLRVLNDDHVIGSAGFDTHPHKDMEIISVPLAGGLKHKDSEGNETVIEHGEVQIMSAGTGVYHSEYNASSDKEVNFLQIWVLPEKLGIAPRYDQKTFDPAGRKNQFQTVVSPLDTDEGGVKINQQARFSLIDLDKDSEAQYSLHNPEHGIYVFVIDGEVMVGEESLERRDAMGIIEAPKVAFKARKDAQVLVIEVPMQLNH